MMKEESVKDAAVRQFLLGDVDDEERQRIESLFISEPEMKKRLLFAEDRLIEDYLEDCLSTSEKARFLAQYGYTPQQRRKLRITKSIKEYAVAKALLTGTATSAIPKRRTFLSALRLRNPRFFIPITAILAIAFIVAVVWLVELNSRRTRENNRRGAIERELVDLNAPSSLREAPPQLSIVLPPVSVRSVKPQTELTPRTDTRLVELQLLWVEHAQYPNYRAVLRRVGNDGQFTIPNLHLEKSPNGSVVRLRLPAHLLTSGLYQVSLSGIADNGASEQAEEYTFEVGG
jgi:hypothetical protein